jgi:ligand-binding sensor domain-containing protein
VWAATSGGIGRYLASEERWITYTGAHGLPSPNTNAIVVAAGPGGEVWVYILWEGVYRFVASQDLNAEDGRWQKVGGISGIVSDVAFAADGTPWIASAGGLHYPGGTLAYRENGMWVDVSDQEGLVSIRPIAFGPNGQVAAGTALGLGVYQDRAWRMYRDGPMTQTPTTVATTPDGATWLGFGDYSASTSGKGVSRFSMDEGWQYLLGDEEVTALAAVPDGSLWAGVGCTVRRYAQRRWETLARCGQEMPAGNITDIAFTPNGHVWVANGFALSTYDGQSWTVYEKLVHSIEAAPDGSVWVEGWRGSQGSYFVARFDGLDWTYHELKDAPVRGFSVGAVTPDGTLWGFGVHGEILSFDDVSWTDPDSWRSYSVPLELSDSFRGMAVAPDGSIWVGGETGASRFDPQALPNDPWTFYPLPPDLTTDLGPGMSSAIDGSFWFGATCLKP